MPFFESIEASQRLEAGRFATYAGAYPLPGARAAGVCQNNAKIGESVSVISTGPATAVAGVEFGLDADGARACELGVDGRIVPAAGGVVVCFATEASLGEGSRVRVYVNSAGGGGALSIFANGAEVGVTGKLDFAGQLSVTVLEEAEGGGIEVRYPPPTFKISFFNNDAGTRERGDTLTSVTLTWQYNPSDDPTTQTIDQGVGSVDVTQRSIFIEGLNIVNDFTWQLSATSPDGNASKTTTVDFLARIYWGNDPNTALNEAQVKALPNSKLANSRQGTYAFPSGNQVYKYFAWPSDLGTLDPTTGFIDTQTGFPVAFNPHFNVTVTNAFGLTETYVVYRSYFKLNGAMNIQVT